MHSNSLGSTNLGNPSRENQNANMQLVRSNALGALSDSVDKSKFTHLLFQWTEGDKWWPKDTTIDKADAYSFQSPISGSCLIRVRAWDAENNTRIGLNGKEVGVFAGPDRETKWFEFVADNLKRGTNTVQIWSSTQDAGQYHKIEVYSRKPSALESLQAGLGGNLQWYALGTLGIVGSYWAYKKYLS